MGGHIHLLFRLPATILLADAVALVKSDSSKWIREQRKTFAWQEDMGPLA
jgi:REP element-mobilizing transposase RayT